MNSFAGPAEVKGFYQKIRDLLQPVLIVIFLAAPWIQFRGQPLLLFDIFNRHFVFFGSTFYSHEAPLLFFLAILLILSIFFITALYGRLWCGWVCPHTVFIHSVFNRIERFILGSYAKRMLFFKNEDSFSKKIKTLMVYVAFLAVCWMLSHSFVAYFVGSRATTRFVLDGPSLHLGTFTVCSIMTLVLFFNFAFFREKLCVYVCPYGRFQNALIDGNSLVVFYDQMRGEPRGKISSSNTDTGDCVDCNRCVTVCPAKIDIRKGFQLECIACGQCIDACNAVMQKINRPQKLIRYETGNQKPITFKRFRLALYGLLIVLFLSGLIFSLYQRSDVDLNINRAHTTPYSSRMQNDQKILQNQIQLHIKNQAQKQIEIFLSLSQQNQIDGFRLLTPALHMNLEPGQDVKTAAFIEINQKDFEFGKNDIQIILKMDDAEQKRNIKFIRQD